MTPKRNASHASGSDEPLRTPEPHPHPKCHDCHQFFKCEELPPCAATTSAEQVLDKIIEMIDIDYPMMQNLKQRIKELRSQRGREP